ncbi:MAG: phage holin family protein [Anaerolineaceae bacterium]|nr:MAG: phage holin family protein [Anaerolineaceae bacterium]
MNKFLIRWIINSLAVWAAVSFVPGIHWTNDWISLIGLGLILTLVNAIVRPLAKFVGCLPIILTLGLFALVINAGMFWLTGVIGNAFGVGFTVDGFWPAFLGGLVVSVVSLVMGMFLRDELKGKRK